MTIIQIGIGILATIMMIIAIELTIQFGIFIVYFILSKQAACEQKKLLREWLKERYKNDIYS